MKLMPLSERHIDLCYRKEIQSCSVSALLLLILLNKFLDIQTFEAAFVKAMLYAVSEIVV